jgi:hypothetical protein
MKIKEFKTLSSQNLSKLFKKQLLGIRDILVQIWIPGSIPLTNGSGSISQRYGSGNPDLAADPALFFSDFRKKKNIIFSIFCL